MQDPQTLTTANNCPIVDKQNTLTLGVARGWILGCWDRCGKERESIGMKFMKVILIIHNRHNPKLETAAQSLYTNKKKKVYVY